jgi:hypothetical protein
MKPSRHPGKLGTSNRNFMDHACALFRQGGAAKPEGETFSDSFPCIVVPRAGNFVSRTGAADLCDGHSSIAPDPRPLLQHVSRLPLPRDNAHGKVFLPENSARLIFGPRQADRSGHRKAGQRPEEDVDLGQSFLFRLLSVGP